MEMTFRAGPARDCVTVGHDFRLTLARRVRRGGVIHQIAPAAFLVTACSGCGMRA